MNEEDLPSQEEERKFYAALGRAVTGWADLEAVLFEITHSVLGCTKEQAAIIFYRTPTMDSRLTLTNDLVHAYFPKHEPGEQPDGRIKRWKEIQAEIRDHLPVRNRLAHHPVGPVVDIYETADGKENRIEIRPASYISLSEHLRKRDQGPAILGIEEVRAHTFTVSRLTNEIRNFYRLEFRRPPSTRAE